METDQSNEPPRLTVDRLRALLESSGKGWGVLIAGTPEDTQFVTWGRTPEQKVYASDLSERLSKELCGDAPALVVYESFKLDAAKNKARVEQLEAEVKLLREHIGLHIELDPGKRKEDLR